MDKNSIKFSPAVPKIIWVVLILILSYFLIMEHRAHIAPYLSTILLLLFILMCQLMHLSMHHNHSNQDKHKHTKKNEDFE